MAILLILSLASCGGTDAVSCLEESCEDTRTELEAPATGYMLDISGPAVLLPGSRLRVRGTGLEAFGSTSVLTLSGTGWVLNPVSGEGNDRTFEVSPELISALGPAWSGSVLLRDGSKETPPHSVSWTLAQSLPLELTGFVAGETLHFNDPLVVRGQGLLAPGEGDCELVFEGTFAPSSGAALQIEGRLPVLPAEEFSRDRGQALFSTRFTGLRTGAFTGRVALETRDLSGLTQRSTELTLSITIVPPEVYFITPDEGRLGSILQISGAGFVSSDLPGSEGTEEFTLFELDGIYTPDSSGESSKWTGSLVPTVLYGETATFVLAARQEGGKLVSELFAQSSGEFAGTIRAVTGDGNEASLTGPETPIVLRIRATGQVVVLRFLPGFDESLIRFGLHALAPEIRSAVKDIIDDIYAPYHLDVRLEVPTDVDPNHFSTVEIGGPDPNGMGLLGMDNTPGKDVGNLRLFDAIGGANWETQADGYPGFGGVFIEAFLYFSTHPDLPGVNPVSAPQPVDEFDEIFDPVRAVAASFAEYDGQGDPARAAAVQRAVLTLGRLIGETTAHEIGHSLGLANPYGPANSFHNASNEPGCLMDAGGDRPFAERAALPGAEPTHLCHDHPDYLMTVLGPR